ncbi:hypothetical protein PTSG_08180 [Salpingoeca rosetta]|uniref:PPPDE domain-containing protein n=1 Tax=Salpingoeca rosetta (strain ATCC 50818 / BSB-021) TaxID=946362 RepID=F2UI84_SALR5|nr:uncharacterized protein PTSG_08180 [Salpingoeca rosetta]EGD76833.1 hypothetical protein PTSG_08180 [Salpingoeca rosetta]|eukprot:XP_004991205.1 hypothetical protein PTSG_08180 [Salpingoeca rosetta]
MPHTLLILVLLFTLFANVSSSSPPRSSSSSQPKTMSKVQVYLYDLSQGMMASLSPSLLGRHFEAVWHTSIVVYGQEFFFGGGINRAAPGTTAAGRPHQVVDLGETEIPEWMFVQFLHGLQDKFNAETYHLLRNNCNHFSEEAATFLTGQSIPQKVRELPDQFLATPFGQMFAPMIDQMFQQLGGNGAPV